MSWYYGVGSQQFGPFDIEAIRRLVNSGLITRTTPMWRAGMESWSAASSVEELKEAFSTIPPPIAPPAASPAFATAISAPRQVDPAVAALLELLPGLIVYTFGIGHIYAGRLGLGLTLMVGGWLILLINFGLIFLLVGVCTFPIAFILLAVFSSISAYRTAQGRNLEGFAPVFR
jgi:hypothetical protein